MKKIFLIFPVLAVMLLFACQKTPDVHITEHEKAKTVTVEAPAGFVWGEDDRIVVNGMKSSLTELDMEDDTRVTFSFNVGVEVPHCAVYPVSMFDSWSKEDKTAKVVIPTVQTSDGNTINPETKLMLGYGDELGKVEISDAMAYIRLTPTKGETAFNISSVKVSDPEGYAVSGKFTARFSEEGRTLENTKQDGSIIDVTCGATGAALGSDIFFAVPAKTYSKGLQFEIYDMDGSFQDMIFPSEGEFVAEAGKTYTKAFVYEPKSILDLGEIPNVEIWNRFAAKIRGGEDFTGRSFKLTANISSDNLEMADGVFNGMLDGNGKTISRSAATRPLFREFGAEAEVTNLTLTGEFSAFEKPYEYGNAALAQINLGNVTNVSANCSVNLRLDGVPSLLGGIVAQNGGVMKSCTNDGNVSLEVAVGGQNGKDVACANFGGGLAAYGHTIAGLDPNTGLYFADEESTIEATPNADLTYFTVADYPLSDATAYTSLARFTVDTLTYTRKFSDNKWMAVYVPFVINCDILDGEYEMAVINNFHEYEQEDGSYKVVLEVKRVTKGGTIPALTPCLIRMKTAPEAETYKTLTFTDVQFVPAAEKSTRCFSVTRNYEFFGTLNGKDGFDEYTDYVLSKGILYKAGNNTHLLPQRWYLTATTRDGNSSAYAKVRSITINDSGDGQATGIDDIHVNTESCTDASPAIYDLQGRRLTQEPQKGVYIKNGVKQVK